MENIKIYYENFKMYDLMLESLLEIDQPTLMPREHQKLIDVAKGLISKLLGTIFDSNKDKPDAVTPQVIDVLDKFFSERKNPDLVDHLLDEIF